MINLTLLDKFNIAQFYRYIGKYDKALTYYRKVYDNPNEIIYTRYFGFIYRGIPIEINFPLEEIEYHMALCHYKKRAYSEAILCLEKIFTLHRSDCKKARKLYNKIKRERFK